MQDLCESLSRLRNIAEGSCEWMKVDDIEYTYENRNRGADRATNSCRLVGFGEIKWLFSCGACKHGRSCARAEHNIAAMQDGRVARLHALRVGEGARAD